MRMFAVSHSMRSPGNRCAMHPSRNASVTGLWISKFASGAGAPPLQAATH